MQKLVDGIHRFQTTEFRARKQLFEHLAKKQTPAALFITCSDSRIDPNLMTNSNPGDLFIVRNVGNIVPPHGSVHSAEAAAVEFALTTLGVKDIIVCGHTHCGAMTGLLAPDQLAHTPAVADWLRHAESTQRIIRENYKHLEGDALVTATAEENVLVQIEHLRTLPVVAAGLARNEISLHAWMYKFETGQVFAFDAEARQFIPVGEQSSTEPVSM